MAKTLLNGVNEVLKRVKVINGDSGVLATLTDSARQNYIDVAVQVVNEGIEDLYSRSSMSLPLQMAEDSITLVTSDRDYALATDLNRLHFPLHDQTNGHYIFEWKSGFHVLESLQLQPADHTGRATHAAIRPSDGQLYLNRVPTAQENGDIYTYNYDKDVSLSVAADTVPFEDNVFRAMVPVWAQLWQRDRNRDFDAGLVDLNYGRASRLLRKIPARDSWLPH